jgi:hypothetical protein
VTRRRSTSGSRSGSGRVHGQLLGEPIGRAAAERAVEAQVGAFAKPAVELLLVVEHAKTWLRSREHARYPGGSATPFVLFELMGMPRASYW